MQTEKWYGIRIGDPRRHFPYLMLDQSRRAPALFLTKGDAQSAITADMDRTARVVVVKLNYGK